MIFEARDLTFRYVEATALDSVSFGIEPLQRVAILGANGSGKSTLLRLLDGLCFASKGAVLFDGQELTERSLADDAFAEKFRRSVALVFQNPDVQLFNPTVFDELAFGPLQTGMPGIESLVAAMLDRFEITHLKDRAPHRLSGGEKKRVALASVLVLDPEVLLLDEPTATLDPRSQSQVIDLIQEWKGSSKTVIAATHQLEIVEDIADRVVLLEEGKLAAAGTPVEILSNHELLLRANLVHAHRHSHNGVVHSHPHIHSHSKHEH
jgi:cobalt/nickel transport system ATP-binding protein